MLSIYEGEQYNDFQNCLWNRKLRLSQSIFLLYYSIRFSATPSV